MPISLGDHRITAILEDAVWELCFLGMTQIRRVAPHDVAEIRAQLRAWGEASDVVVNSGTHGHPDNPTIWARLCG